MPYQEKKYQTFPCIWGKGHKGAMYATVCWWYWAGINDKWLMNRLVEHLLGMGKIHLEKKDSVGDSSRFFPDLPSIGLW